MTQKKKVLPRIKNIFKTKAEQPPTPADYAACQEKRQYDTFKEAKAKGFRVYKCRVCGKLHRASDKKYLREHARDR